LIIAKRKEDKLQSLKEHTEWVIEESLKFNIDKISKFIEWDKEKIRDFIFFCATFHDLGKATKEFQNTILHNKKSYHSLYSASLLVDIDEFYFEGINLLLLVILTHHSLLDDGLYSDKKIYNFEFLEFDFDYKKLYEKYRKKECKYDFKLKYNDGIFEEIDSIKDELKYLDKEKFRVIYSFFSGVLNISDWLASAKFNQNKIQLDFGFREFDFELKLFQKEAQKETSILIEIPTGEGKTEAGLLWAKTNSKKIIYTLPTTTTSNKLYERIKQNFDNVGLIHSNAKFYLENQYENENGVIDDDFLSDYLFQKSFNKPITISTLDAVFKHFLNLSRFNIAIKNYLDSVVVIDEVHSFDFKMLGFLNKVLEFFDKMDIKYCLMSATLPTKIKQLLNLKIPTITQKELFLKKANQIIKKEIFLDEDIETILKHKDKKILIVRNRIDKAKEIFNLLREFELDVILYHSSFKKKDRVKKENIIYQKLKENKPFILVATQVVEISLDINFEIMFSDIAPIDSLVQRFGRVNRDKTKKGLVYIYQVDKFLPYDEEMLDISFEIIENGYFEIRKYNEWLEKLYNKVFEIKKYQNKITSLFKKGQKMFDDILEECDSIKKNSENYEIRDINYKKEDFILVDDYDKNDFSFENSISLPVWYFQKYGLTTPYQTKFRILNLKYSFEEGVMIEDKEVEFL